MTIRRKLSFMGMSVGMLTADGLIPQRDLYEMELADGEMVLNYELYAQLFEAKSKWYYVDSEMTQINELPAGIGEKFELKFYNTVTGDLIADFGEFTLKGVVFQRPWRPDEVFTREMSVSSKVNDKIQAAVKIRQTILVKSDSVDNFIKLINTLESKYDTRLMCAGKVGYVGITHWKDVVELTYEMIDTMNYCAFIMTAIGAIMIVVLLLLVVNLISFSIASRKREIGILSALGTSNRDVTKIFLFETLIIAAISFVVTLALSFVLAVGFNNVMRLSWGLELTLSVFRVDIFTIAVLIVSSFGLLLLAAWIPTRNIAKLKPIDAIRNI